MYKEILKTHSDFFQNLINISWQERIKEISKLFPKNASFSTSFSIEDQIITHEIFKHNLNIETFTLDTGRHFEETYKVWDETIKKYNKPIKAFYPNTQKIEEFVNEKGPNSFYESKDNRLGCCYLRKVEPLTRALKGKDLWISGIRKGHSNERNTKDFYEIDEAKNILKFYPILDLSDKEIWNFIKEQNIPYNKLYDKNFTSIGCAPCTKATKPGEDPRAGRWWWETDNQKECGLHMVNGKLVRKK